MPKTTPWPCATRAAVVPEWRHWPGWTACPLAKAKSAANASAKTATHRALPSWRSAACCIRRFKPPVVTRRGPNPLEAPLLRQGPEGHDALVTLEEGAIMGGAGSAVTETLNAAGILRPVLQLGLADIFIEHGDPAKLLAMQGLNAAGIRAAIAARFPAIDVAR